MMRRPPRSTLFPYTPLSRSDRERVADRRALAHEPLIAPGVEDPGHVQRVVGEPGEQEIEHAAGRVLAVDARVERDRKSTRLNSSHANISYAVFCLKQLPHPL